MDKNQNILIIVVVALTIIGGIAYFLKTSADAAEKVRDELNLIVEPMLVDISSTWHPKTFYKYSSSELKSWLKENGWDEVNRYSQLGKMTKYYGIKDFNMWQDEADIAYFADFENGKARVELSLLKSENKWYIQNLEINPAN